MRGLRDWRKHASSAAGTPGISHRAAFHSPAVGAAAHDLHGQTGNPSVATIYQGDNPSPWAQIATAISCFAAGMAIMVAVLYPRWEESAHAKQAAEVAALRLAIDAQAERIRYAERESRVATERYNDIAKELARRGIPLSDH